MNIQTQKIQIRVIHTVILLNIILYFISQEIYTAQNTRYFCDHIQSIILIKISV